MIDQKRSLDETRAVYAQLMASASGSDDPRLERVFGSVLREAFMPKGPWRIMHHGRYVETPDADPRCLYQNTLVALDAGKGINNGEPFLHAAWIGAVAPRPGESVTQIGAGTGYYTALLSKLVEPGGRVEAFEIDPALAETARANLAAYDGVSVTTGDATKLPVPLSDLIYVNAGVVAPPLGWLQALRPAGRLIFPWRPAADVGLTLLVVRTGQGFAVKPLMPSLFIPCVGASETSLCEKTPTMAQARATRSAWVTSQRQPDRTAVAICGPVWFSREALKD